ncbi:hypothetical protein OS188_05845, partial [Xanthomarina sp. F1114]|uniref:hypothetical protein n=1 Tax=Xanthomarina sp. F1114 TaxID=2996019 RepID=UPI00225E6B72
LSMTDELFILLILRRVFFFAWLLDNSNPPSSLPYVRLATSLHLKGGADFGVKYIKKMEGIRTGF